MRLYDMDLRASNELLQSGETALNALRKELHTLKASSLVSADDPKPSRSLEPVKKAEQEPIFTPRKAEPLSKVINNCTNEEVVTVHADADKVVSSSVDSRHEEVTTLCQYSDTKASSNNLAAERLQRAIAEATEALSALLGAAALEHEEEDVEASWENRSCADQLPRARSEGANRIMMQPGALRTSRRRRLSRGGEPLRVAFAEGEASEPTPEPERLAFNGCDPDEEPEPSPEAPSTPERSPQSQPRELRAPAPRLSWQRNLGLAPVGGRRGQGYGRLEYDGAPSCQDAGECARGRRRERRDRRELLAIADQVKSPRVKAPTTAMDFL